MVRTLQPGCGEICQCDLGMIYEKHSVLDGYRCVLRGLDRNASVVLSASTVFCNFEVAGQFRK
jgi:hypothetical protein